MRAIIFSAFFSCVATIAGPNLYYGLPSTPATAPAFVPTSVSGLTLWLDSTDSATLFQNTALTTPVTAAGQSVQGWKDKSALGNNATQATGAPTYNSSSVINAAQAASVAFSGTQTLLATAVNIITASAYTAWFVLQPTSGFGSCATGSMNGSAPAFVDSGDGYIVGANCTGNFFQLGGYASGYKNILTAYTPTSSYIVQMRQDATTFYSKIGSATETSVAYGTASTYGNLVLGGDRQHFTGYMGEVIFYNNTVSAGNQAGMLTYLKAKWGI